MDPRDELVREELDRLGNVFREQLMACLEECARGRRGLFTEPVGQESEESWPEAARLRELALALQSLFTQHEARDALCDEFLDLCTMHGESDPGEGRLAWTFLKRIGRGEVGTLTVEEKKPR